MIVSILDALAGLSVIVCLLVKFKIRWLWVLYACACLFYGIINFYKVLPGQAIMNLVAMIIAIRNYFSKTN